MRTVDCDYLIIGSGIAGLTTALHLAPHGRVMVVTKKAPSDCNTNYAQGGIACVTKEADSFDMHVQDTLEAGAGLCHPEIVEAVVSAGPERIAAMGQLGIDFEKWQDKRGYQRYDVSKEGGHSKRRVLHAGDITGRCIESVLLERVAAEPAITVVDHVMAIDLITTAWLDRRRGRGAALEALGDSGGTDAPANRCVGAYVLDRNRGEIKAIRAPYVILASGGGGKVYLYTSNPDVATGDGVAMAWRAGVPIRNMEFIQFHPTCLYHAEAKSFLISEAVRGEGAKLVDASGRDFMQAYDPRGALAPRDIVARAIDSEMKRTGAQSAFLDIRHRGRDYLEKRFPTISATCRRFGFDMAEGLIPVVPAAHYFCGGIEAGLDGVTQLPGLFAIGEVACTGLHGANRLASNSLLEAAVCSHRLAERLADAPLGNDMPRVRIPDWEYGDAVSSDEAIVVEHNWNEVRTCMWDYVGIVRTDKRLDRALRRIQNLRGEIRDYYFDYLVTPDILELRNIAAVAELIIRSARHRKESRGLHFTLDYPERAPSATDTIIQDRPGTTPAGR